MLSFGAGNKEIYGEALTLVGSAARTTNGTGPTVAAGDNDTLRLVLDVTAVSGVGPSVTVTLEHSGDGTTWTTHSSFAAVTAVSATRKVFGGIDRYVRATWVIAASVTFSVAGELV